MFQGRRDVIADLKQWVLAPVQTNKLLAICGIGGIGKTSLTRKLAESLEGYFAQVVWLTARERQTPSELLHVLLETLLPDTGDASEGEWALSSAEVRSQIDAASQKTVQKMIHQLIACFSQQSCLVVIDGFEVVFKSYQSGRAVPSVDSTKKHGSGSIPTFQSSRKQQASLYRDDLTAYEDLFDALRQPLSDWQGESVRKKKGRKRTDRKTTAPTEKGAAIGMSCLLLTSREKPKELLSIPEGDPHARLYTLDGLKDHEAARMLSQFRLRGKAVDYKELVDRYYGHPMALRLAANAVKDMFYGQIRDFLDQEISVFDDLRSVLKTQVRRLSPSEIEVMYWLAINHAPCTLEGLQSDVVSQDLKENLLYVLQSLERRFLVDVKQVGGASFELHPIVAEYVLNHFIREIFQDLINGDLSLFNRHALMKADAEDSCRDFQKNAIVRPILERLRNYFKSLFEVDEYLNSKLDNFRENNPYRLGYAGGNFVNLMVELSQGKLTRKDFSKLTIWQAYLQGAQLREVNFTSCELNRSVFTETVSDVMAIAFNDVEQFSTLSAVFAAPVLACGDTRGMVHVWLTGPEQGPEQAANPLDGRLPPFVGAPKRAAAGQKCAEWSAHNGWVRSLAFLRRQSCVLTGGDDNVLKLWQLPLFGQQSMSQPRLLWQEKTAGWVHAIALSPDEKTTAIGGENTITLYNTASGQKLCQWCHEECTHSNSDDNQRHPSSPLTKRSAVRSLTFSPDGQCLASCGDDNVIRLWSVDSHRDDRTSDDRTAPVRPIAELVGHTDCVHVVKISVDGSELLSGSDDGTVRMWSVTQGGAEQQKVLRQPGDRIRTLAVSPDGRLLASGGDDCQLWIWDLATQQLIETVSTHGSRIWSVAFQQQGNKQLLAAGGDKQRVMLWQVHTLERMPNEILPNETVLDETFPNETLPEALRTDKSLSDKNLPNLKVTARAVRTYRGYTNGIRAVSFLGPRHVVSAGDNRDLSVWSRADGARKATFSMHQGRIWAIAVDPHNARIASASDDHTIGLWDANTGQCLMTFAEHTSWARTVAFSQRGRFLASSGDDCTIRIWNTASGFCLKSLRYGAHWIHAVCFDPVNSRYLVSGGDDKILRRWDRKEGISHSLAVHDHRICSVAYSPNGELVASGSDDHTVILWDLVAYEIICRFTQPELGIKAVAFSPDGRYLAAGGEDQLVYLWDLQTPERACARLRFQSYAGLAGGIRAIQFSPDGQSIISGGLDETIRICDLSGLRRLGQKDVSAPHELPVFIPLIQPERP
ncbi:MAG: WD40 repeat domain-containing protein, partial [Cyanobacteria bacterium P01_F01_bin.3]